MSTHIQSEIEIIRARRRARNLAQAGICCASHPACHCAYKAASVVLYAAQRQAERTVIYDPTWTDEMIEQHRTMSQA